MTVERFPVEATHIAMFARAVADPNPVCYDADCAVSTELGGGIPAPPTSVQTSAQFDPYYPLHNDEVYTTQVAGHPSVFAHGMLTMGMTGRAMTDWVGDGRLTKCGIGFSKQVWPGDSLTATVTVAAIRVESRTASTSPIFLS